MKNRKRKIYPIIILIATLFMGIGYASVNSVLLGIEGTLQADLQDGIYITDVNYDSSITADYENSKIIYAYQTMLNSDIILSETDSNSLIIYEITIYNSNSDDYIFIGEEYLESEDTYSNEDITFELSGLAPGDILKGKDSITFTITFYYKDNVLSSNNNLNSLLNFNFKKIYYVTYENFSSTSDYPIYVVEGETLSISFGTLDTPIEVKQSDTILDSSEYSYSDYILILNDVNGDIHIRKLNKYTITNMVENGSFENGLNGWTIIGGSSTITWYETTISYVGSKAYYRVPSEYGVNYLRQTLSFINGHKYYFFAHAICTTTQPFYADVAYTNSSISFNAIPNYYRRGSVIHTADSTGNEYIHINFAYITGNVIVDGIGVIDLTDVFGTENEPDLTWCNENINYFDGSTIVYK